MQGRLKSITLKSSQEAWKLDLPETLAPAPPGSHGQPQPPAHQVPISSAHIASRFAGQHQKYQKRVASSSEHQPENDDDDFMPPRKHHASARASSSMEGNHVRRIIRPYSTIKVPSVRCAPLVFNKFTEHLNMPQRTKISELGFGSLLQFYAYGLDSSDLLVYLMDKLNPDSMVLEVGNEGGLCINEWCVRKVLGLPDGEMDPPSSTEVENALALSEFRNSVHAERNKEVTCNHLLHLLRKINIGTSLAVRIFFVVTFNKLLFPAIDNNIRGRDSFLTKDVSHFGNINWCKAVLQDLHHATIMWRSEKKKTIPGCGIFLIIFYLDNLDSRSSIVHSAAPRAKYYHKSVMENLIREDKGRDKAGNVMYGNLQLRNIADTCYHHTELHRNGVSRAEKTKSSSMLQCAEELGVLSNELDSTSSRNKSTDGLQQFAAKASRAVNIIQSDSNMLVDAHKEFILTIQVFSRKKLLKGE